ncbi:MAG: D-amino acid dehydrogenase [Kiloniellaceae bacterium]
MKVVVLGSGIVGVSTAYYLAKAGHEVVVIDRQSEAAMETSFANAGEVSPGYSSPWAGPGMPVKAVKWMLHKHSPLVIRPRIDIYMFRWLYRMLKHCTLATYRENKARMLRVATYSRDCLEDLRRDTGIAYDERCRGTLQMFRDQKGLDDAAKDVEILKEFGIGHSVLDRAGCIVQEPALKHVAEMVAGGLRLPGDETGDCFLFTQRLAELAAGLGVTFKYETTIKRLVVEGGKVKHVEIRDATGGGTETADAYVAALGSYTPMLVRPHGIRTQVYPVKGYSVTVPIVDEDGAPVSTMMDEKSKVAITRLGDRIRAAGTAELTGYNMRLSHGRCAMLFHIVQDLFPKGGDLTEVKFWTGLRPMIPDGGPLIGPTSLANLYLNTGHGTLGWTMGPGSGKLLADLLSQRPTDIPLDGLTIDRFPQGQGI